MRAVRERTVHDDAWFWTTSMISTSTPCRDLDRRRRPGHHGHHDARRVEGLQLWVHVHRTPRCVLGYWLALCPVPAVRLTLCLLHVMNALSGPHGTLLSCSSLPGPCRGRSAHNKVPRAIDRGHQQLPKEPAKLADVQMLVAVETL